jgi:hypothetical protein
MYGRLVIALLPLVLACGNGESGTITQDDVPRGTGDTLDVAGKVDLPGGSCEGRECGDDGAGGSCGGCEPFLEECNPDGQCVAFACSSSKDCPGSLVCAEAFGECVACVGDEDCPEEETCGADHKCHAVYVCDSDKDCKELDMVCDKEAGLCVECLKSEHCDDGMICTDGFCLEAACPVGESKCEGNDVLACDGMTWSVAQTCGAAQYCEDGACVPCACEGGDIWCDGEVYKVCADDCKSVQYEEDCDAKEQHCFNGACIDTVCVPLEDFCVDNDTTGKCAPDGLSFDSTDCADQQSCDGGLCKPWLCTPGDAMCDGDTATTCDPLGLGPAAGGTDCAGQDKFCSGGECTDCEPQCDGKSCGDDGCGGQCGECAWPTQCDGTACTLCDDGNNVDWDGCTDGQLSEFRANSHLSDWQRLPSLAPMPDGTVIASWQTNGQFASGVQVVGKVLSPGTGGVGTENLISGVGNSNSTDPMSAYAGTGLVLVAWMNSEVDGDGNGIAARLVDASAKPLGESMQVNTKVMGHQSAPRVDCVIDQECLVVWTDQKSSPNMADWAIAGQRIGLDGEKNGLELSLLNSTGVHSPAVACVAAGDCVLVWTEEGGDSNMNAVWAGTLQVGDAFISNPQQVNTEEVGKQEKAAISVDGQGNFLAAWTSTQQDPGGGNGVFGRRFSIGSGWGEAQFQISEPMSGNQWQPQVAGSSVGGFMVVWHGSSLTDGEGIAGRLITANGTLGTQVDSLNVFTVGKQMSARIAFASQDFFVIWESDMGADMGTQMDIMAIRLNAEGSPQYL